MLFDLSTFYLCYTKGLPMKNQIRAIINMCMTLPLQERFFFKPWRSSIPIFQMARLGRMVGIFRLQVEGWKWDSGLAALPLQIHVLCLGHGGVVGKGTAR